MHKLHLSGGALQDIRHITVKFSICTLQWFDEFMGKLPFRRRLYLEPIFASKKVSIEIDKQRGQEFGHETEAEAA